MPHQAGPELSREGKGFPFCWKVALRGSGGGRSWQRRRRLILLLKAAYGILTLSLSRATASPLFPPPPAPRIWVPMKESDGCREGGRSTLEECSSHPCREGQVEFPSRNLTVAGDKCPGIFQSQAQGSLFPLPLEKECIWTGVRCVLGRPSFVLFLPFWSKKSQHSRQLSPGQQVRVHSQLEG